MNLPLETLWVLWFASLLAAMLAHARGRLLWKTATVETRDCRACGYPMAGIDPGRCPECGITSPMRGAVDRIAGLVYRPADLRYILATTVVWTAVAYGLQDYWRYRHAAEMAELGFDFHAAYTWLSLRPVRPDMDVARLACGASILTLLASFILKGRGRWLFFFVLVGTLLLRSPPTLPG